MQVTFLEAKMALVKRFGVKTDDGSIIDKAYPKAANFKTHTHHFDTSSEYHALLQEAAYQWFGMLKGKPNRELTAFESRRKLTDRETPTNILVLDIDGLKWPVNTGRCDQETLTKYAEDFVKLLPAPFQAASYVAVASSSMAYKAGLRMHLHFLLSEEKQPSALRGLITWLNLEVPYIRKNVGLTPARAQLSLPVDPCVADNSRIIYIAPPIFESGVNPFLDNKERIIHVQKDQDLLEIDSLLSNIDPKKLEKEKESLLEDTLRQLGIEKVRPKLQSVHHRGKNVRVLRNPDSMTFEIAEVTGDFVRYNINDGDSNAYWVWMDNPDIVYSFKPDELPFSFRAANPEAYEEHLRLFQKEINKARMVEVGGEKFTPMIVYDEQAGTHFAIRYNANDDSLVRCVPIAKGNVEDWLGSFGLEKPEKMPQYEVIFDPTSSVCLDTERTRINTYKVPTLVKEAPAWSSDPLSFGDAAEWMEANTPVCYQIIMNMLGDDLMCFEQFINWFAFLVQHRRKPETAWVVHGVEGTGKGLFIKAIAKPLLGERYVHEKFLNDIANDKFNGFMAESLLVFVDEFNIHGARNVRQAVDMLKLQITQNWLNIREMQQNPVMRETYFGMIFASNDVDQMRISASDRRYNVAPRQETPLNRRILDLQQKRTEYDKRIADEVIKLSSMIQAYEIEEHRVRTPIENEAKRNTRLAGLNQDELFIEAFKNGDLHFFDYLVTEQGDPREAILTQRIKAEVLQWMADCVTGEISHVGKENLRQIFVYMTDINISAVAWGRKCKQHGIYESKSRVGDSRIRSYSTKWVYKDLEVLKGILENNVRRAAGA